MEHILPVKAGGGGGGGLDWRVLLEKYVEAFFYAAHCSYSFFTGHDACSHAVVAAAVTLSPCILCDIIITCCVLENLSCLASKCVCVFCLVFPFFYLFFIFC